MNHILENQSLTSKSNTLCRLQNPSIDLKNSEEGKNKINETSFHPRLSIILQPTEEVHVY